MGFFNSYKNDKSDDRSHQDNCLHSEIDAEKWDNGSYQFCKNCNATRRFQWDRCVECGSN